MWKLLLILLRNQLFLKSCAWPALRRVRAGLESGGFRPVNSHLSLGLTEPNGLRVVIIFGTDSEMTQFNRSHLPDELAHAFKETLARSPWPKGSIPASPMTSHSQEAIDRAGGNHQYFK